VSDSAHRFSDTELEQILDRASKETRSLPVNIRSGEFTIDEIESIASEAGLDVERVRAAAIQVAMDRSRGRFGDTGRIDLRRNVTGAVAAADFGQLAEAISDAAGVLGAPSSTLGSLQWEEPRGADRLQVTVTPGESSTSIRVRTDASAIKGLCYVASLGGALALGGITGAILEPSSAAVGVGIMATAATAGAATGWAAWRARARRLRMRATSVLVHVTERAAELAAARPDAQESR
jgi:hypothetical protein